MAKYFHLRLLKSWWGHLRFLSYPLKDYLGIFQAPKQNPELKKFSWNIVTANLKLHILIVLKRQHFEKNNQRADLVKSRSCSWKIRIVWSSRSKIFFIRKLENTALAFLTCMIHRVVFWKIVVLKVESFGKITTG